MRRLALALSLAAALVPFAVARAGEDAADGKAAETEGIRWIDGWSAGRRVARERALPMLVYVGRHSPH